MSDTSIPQSAGLPIVGHLAGIIRHGLLDFARREWHKHGDIFSIRAGGRHLLCLVNPSHVEQVLLKNTENYYKGKNYDNFRLLTGEGLVTLEGDVWRSRRRMLQPSFHRTSINRFVELMVESTQTAISRWRREIPYGGTIEAHREMMRLTLDVVSRTLFGQDVNEHAADASHEAFADTLQLVSDRGNSMVALPITVPTPSNIKLRKSISFLDGMVYQTINKARAMLEQQKNGATSDEVPTLLSMLLAAQDEDTGNGLSNEEIRNEVMTLFLAGHETTALTLTWGFTLLCKNPHIIEEMRAEIQHHIGDRTPTAEDIYKLTYVRQVIDEILRLRSPVWIQARNVRGDDVFSLNGKNYHIGPDDTAALPNYLTHRHPEFWPNPEKFDPSRFTPEAIRARPVGAYFPFSLGQRMCIGNIFSLVETALIFTMILQNCNFNMKSHEEIPYNPAITLRPTTNVLVDLQWRH